MEAVSNQQSYEPIEPLPIPEEHYTELIKLISRVVLIAAITSFGGVIGLSLGLAELGFSVTAGAIGGAVVGGAAVFLFLFGPLSLQNRPVPARYLEECLQTAGER